MNYIKKNKKIEELQKIDEKQKKIEDNEVKEWLIKDQGFTKKNKLLMN